MRKWLFDFVLSFYFLIGCDSTSAFHGKGKGKPWKILQEHLKFVESFSQLGRSFIISEDLVISLNSFVCLLYGDKISTNVDDCRYILFKSGKCSDDALPPNCDSLLKHIERANLQAAAWNRCLSPQLQLPPAPGNGWRLSDGQLEIIWMTRPSAPDSLLEYVQCKCKTGCKTQRCSCLKAGLRCTDFCGCADCQNGQPEESDEEKLSDSSYSSDWDQDSDGDCFED